MDHMPVQSSGASGGRNPKPAPGTLAPAIRPYADADRDAVLSLFTRVNRALAPPALRSAFEDYIALSIQQELGRIPAYYSTGNGAAFWVCEQDGQLPGMFGIERHDATTAELRRMYVAPEMRRRGIARAMLTHAEQACRDAGYRRLVLSTSELQPAAIALYQAMAYRMVREEVAVAASNKTVGGNVRRFHFAKDLNG
jgi:putative acetyltransferase